MDIHHIHTEDKYYWIQFKGTFGFLGDSRVVQSTGMVSPGDTLGDLLLVHEKLNSHFRTGFTINQMLWQDTEDPDNAGCYNIS